MEKTSIQSDIQKRALKELINDLPIERKGYIVPMNHGYLSKLVGVATELGDSDMLQVYLVTKDPKCVDQYLALRYPGYGDEKIPNYVKPELK